MAKVKGRCAYCGREFVDFPSMRRRFCCRACYVEYWHEYVQQKILATKAKARVTTTCSHCGKVFSDAQSNHRVYCSRRCSDIASYGKTANEGNGMWKGEAASTQAKHLWIKWRYGRPEACEFCGVKGRSSKGRWTIHWANISGKYLRDRNDYYGLCRKCHYHFDTYREEYDGKAKIPVSGS